MPAIKSDRFASALVNLCIVTKFSPAKPEKTAKPTIRPWGAEVCLKVKVNVDMVEVFGRSCALCPAGAGVGRRVSLGCIYSQTQGCMGSSSQHLPKICTGAPQHPVPRWRTSQESSPCTWLSPRDEAAGFFLPKIILAIKPQALDLLSLMISLQRHKMIPLELPTCWNNCVSAQPVRASCVLQPS